MIVAGDYDACYYLSYLYRAGIGVNRDLGKVYDLLVQGTKAGNPKCSYGLAFLLLKLIKSEENDALARQLLENNFEALLDEGENGDPYSLTMIGNYAFYGLIEKTPLDYERAVKFYLLGAEKGVLEAFVQLGICYRNGLGVPPDYAKAFYYFGSAAEEGDISGEFNLALAYYHGQGVKQDYARCVYWLNKAAVKGDSASQLYLGLSYYAGLGVAVDRGKAVEWLEKSAAQGNEKAQDYLRKI